MRCPTCGAQMVKTLDEPMGSTWVCVDCPEEIDIHFD